MYLCGCVQRTERVALWEASDLDEVTSAFGDRIGLKPEARIKLRALLQRERDEVMKHRKPVAAAPPVPPTQ